MKISITGSRGIPNNYGGFEQCAENLAVLLAKAGHEVTVYNPGYHPYDKGEYKGVIIKKCWNPEKKIGTAGNFIYDYLCLRDALKNKCDILLVLGYTTASIFFPFLNKRKSILITNMDGLEWKRDKWSPAVKKLAKWFESLGAKYSDCLIADNGEIKNYLQSEYKKDATYIGYGAEIFNSPDESVLKHYNVTLRKFNMLVARLEKENNIEAALDAVVLSRSSTPFLVIGKHETPYGEFLKNKYSTSKNIRFLGGIYDINHLNNLRWHCRFYFHGHSVGGTNPSLLEAMASRAFILAHDNVFSRDVLGENAFYFADAYAAAQLLKNASLLEEKRELFTSFLQERIHTDFNWQKITDQYEELFKKNLQITHSFWSKT